MGYHLVAVLLSPFALCLAAALASALWPRRGVLWACLTPAWVLAAMSWGLAQHRGELAGPVLQWCRVDVVGLAITAAVLPASALWWRSIDAPRAAPWRFALFQASMAPIAIVPLPCVFGAVALLPAWTWRHRAAPLVLALLAGASLCWWPWGVSADMHTAIACAALVVLARPIGRARQIAVAVGAAAAVLALVRAVLQFAG
jgi:hypothetical protein